MSSRRKKKGINKMVVICILILICIFAFCGCVANNGMVIEDSPFYSLQAAYNNNYISKANLKKIASLLGTKSNIVLSDEKSTEIKEAFIKKYPQDGVGIENVEIRICLGDYDGSIAIMIDYQTTLNIVALWSETVGGIKVSYIDGQRILIYKQS